MDKKYHLTNVRRVHIENPNTYDVATNVEIAQLKIGQFAKLVFTGISGENGERMWVAVTEISPDKKKFKGKLANDPVRHNYLKSEDEIEFGSENILDIYKG